MAVDIFANLGDVKGESSDARHRDEIEVLSFSWGVANAAGAARPGGGGGAGKASLQDISFVHRIDKATPGLMRACATGQHLPEGTITMRKAGGAQQDYFVISMKDILVTSVTAAAGSDEQTETVTLRFDKVQVEYRPQKPDGTLDRPVQFGWDVKSAREF